MLRSNFGVLTAIALGTVLVCASACGSDDPPADSTQSGGSSGSGGSSATGGTAGSSTGGTAGTAGTAGGSTGGTAGTAGSGGGQGQTCDDPGVTCVLPPEPPSGPPADGTVPVVFGIKQLYLGDTARGSDTADPNAWKDFGFNLDRLVSTKNDTNHCRPQPGGTKSAIQSDGNGGIDNAFAAHVVNEILAVLGYGSAQLNDQINQGSFTIMLKMSNIGTGANQTGVNTALYGGADLGSSPLFDGTDQWPVIAALLNNNDINSPKITFPNSYVTNNVWVSGTGGGTLALSIQIDAVAITLNIRNAALAVTLDMAATPKVGTNGTIGGVLKTEELVQELYKAAIPLLGCDGASVIDQFVPQIRGYSDIMADGTNGDPSQVCDGISVGLGFEAVEMQLGAVAPPGQGGDDCDGGTDGG